MFFKNQVFSHEEEYRIVFMQIDIKDDSKSQRINKKIEFRNSHGVIIPYIEVSLETGDKKLPISNITIGPKNNIDLAVSGTNYILNYLGYDQIEIRKSEIPIRY